MSKPMDLTEFNETMKRIFRSNAIKNGAKPHLLDLADYYNEKDHLYLYNSKEYTEAEMQRIYNLKAFL